MAKIKHNDFNDTINDLLIEAQRRGVIRLNYESESWEGSSMIVNSINMLNFGTCGYLGLENHQKIIDKSIEYTKKYGVQFSVSRTYLVSKESTFLEELLSKIFYDKKIITFSSTTLLHTAVLPCVVGNRDYVILDQQCHASIQTAAQIVHSKGVPLDIIRHSNIEMLEHILIQNRDKFEKIWYMIDGVYSMFGDLAPIKEINFLMSKYPQLHIYIDDAHGMSWSGKNGCGKLFEETLINNRTIYISTMAKGFGCMGGIVVFPSEYWYNKVKIYGGALTHSHPIAPPMLGAAIASAEIHLSDEIYILQNQLKKKLNFANELFKKTDLPIISNPETPIFFLATGQPAMGYHLNKRILDDGFYVNIALFPAVPIKNTGLRFTITNHNSEEDISNLVKNLNSHYFEVLQKENKTLNDIHKAFKINSKISENLHDTNKLNNFKIKKEINEVNKDFYNSTIDIISNSNLNFNIEKSISKLDKLMWNELFENKGHFDFKNMLLLESAFKNNTKIEYNWDFYYISIFDEENNIVLLTFLTSGLIKDDLLSEEEISRNIENKRKNETYYLCSKTLMMGSLFTEGEHLYINEKHKNSQEAFLLLLNICSKIQENENCNSILLRDFENNIQREEKDLIYFNHNKLEKIVHEKGFFKSNMPNSNVIYNLPDTENDFFIQLSARSKRHIKNDVLSKKELFNIIVEDTLNDDELKLAYKLYFNVSSKNKAINLFEYPFKLFILINDAQNWEFIKLYHENILVSIGICYKGKNAYNPVLVGIDYEKNYEINTYKQMLYQVCLRAIEKKYKQINFGFSADVEKKKLGATQISKCAFLQINDLFSYEKMELSSRIDIINSFN